MTPAPAPPRRALGVALTLAACGAARASAPPPRALAPRGVTTQEFNFTDEIVQGSIGPTLEDDPLPPAFVTLSPREREQWHACRPLLLHRRGGGRCATGRDEIYVRSPRGGFTLNRDPLLVNGGGELVFSLHAADYLALPDAAARRAALLRAGCPDSLLDLADGTHLHLVEGPAASPPR